MNHLFLHSLNIVDLVVNARNLLQEIRLSNKRSSRNRFCHNDY